MAEYKVTKGATYPGTSPGHGAAGPHGAPPPARHWERAWESYRASQVHALRRSVSTVQPEETLGVTTYGSTTKRLHSRPENFKAMQEITTARGAEEKPGSSSLGASKGGKGPCAHGLRSKSRWTPEQLHSQH